jgi:hypothetical protein
MTLTTFVAKSAFGNKRRSILTVASIAFSLLLLCIMLCVWRRFYIDKGAPDSALRIMTATRSRSPLSSHLLPRQNSNRSRRCPRRSHDLVWRQV